MFDLVALLRSEVVQSRGEIIATYPVLAHETWLRFDCVEQGDEGENCGAGAGAGEVDALFEVEDDALRDGE